MSSCSSFPPGYKLGLEICPKTPSLSTERKGKASTKKKSMEKQNIPIFDLQNFPEKYEKLLREACEQWGCFRVVNHSIPISLMSEMKEVTKSLLDLPIEIKKRNTDSTGLFLSGYLGKREINPLYESLQGLYNIESSQAVQDFCSVLDVPIHQRNVIEAYGQAVTGLAMEISEKLIASLGLSHSLEGWPIYFRMNKYSFTPETVGSLGAPIHTDSVFFTILQDDEKVGGLEVMNKSNKYVAVDPLPGSIVVNFGDIATAWSNGRFYNVKHRVQCKEASTRFSIASFVLGPREGPVEAPSEFVDDQNPRLYAPFTWQEYRKLRFANKFKNLDGLSDFRLIH